MAVFWRSTIGELIEMINAANERRRIDAAYQVSAIVRAISASFGGDSGQDPFAGLVDRPLSVPISLAEAKRLRFWRPDGN